MLTKTWTPTHPDTNGWKERHSQAMVKPNQKERGIVLALDGWLSYAESHESQYGRPIGDDYVLGPIWADMGRAIHGLLDGETGRLDCGTISSIINANLEEQEFSL